MSGLNWRSHTLRGGSVSIPRFHCARAVPSFDIAGRGFGHRRLRDMRGNRSRPSPVQMGTKDARMLHYKIYILDRNHRIVLAYDFQGRDDVAALEESRKHSDKSAIEIWEKSRLVAKIGQGGKAAAG